MRKLSTLAVLSMAGLAASAQAQVIAGADDAINAGIWGYDLNTATWTQLAINLGNPTAPWGLAADDVNRRLYWNNGANVGYFPYGVLPGTLDAPVTLGTVTNNGTGLAYNPTTGLLYMVRNIATEAVYSIDPNTLVQNTEFVYDSAMDLGGFDYNAADGFYYATNDATGGPGRGMVRIDLANQTTTLITPYQGLTGEGNDIDGLATGNGRAYFILDNPGDGSVWNFGTASFETPIPSPFTGSETFSAGAFAAGLYGPPPQFDAAISINDTLDPIYTLGTPMSYNVTVANNGTDPVTGVMVTVNLAPEVTYVSDTGGGSHTAGTVTFNLGSIGGGGNIAFSIDVTADVAGVAMTDASVSINETDALPGNDMGSASTTIVDGSQFPAVDVIFSEIPSSPTSDVPGRPGQKFSSLSRPFRSPDTNRWVISGLSDAGTTLDEFIITGSGLTGTTLIQEGDLATWAIDLAFLDEVDEDMSIGNDGMVLFNCDTDELTSVDEYVVRGDSDGFTTIAQEGTTLIPGFADEFHGFMAVGSSNAAVPAILSTSTIGNLPTSSDDFLVLNGVVVAQTGVTIPGNQAGGATAAWQFFDAADFRASADGSSWLMQGDTDDASTSVDDILVVNGNVVIQEGFPVDADIFFDGVSLINEPYMSSSGDWMARGTNSGTSDDWVVLNGEVIAQTGASIGIPSGETWGNASFAATFFLMCADNNGNVVIGGVTSDSNVERDAILLLRCADGTVTELARQGNPVDVDGNGFFDDGAFLDIFNDDDAFLTDDGYLYFTADLQDSPGGTSIGQAFMRIETPGCAAGCPADLSGSADPNDPAYGVPDGSVDASDFFYYLDQFVGGNLAIADLSGSADPNDPGYGVPDGTIDASDFFYYLDLFVAGCP